MATSSNQPAADDRARPRPRPLAVTAAVVCGFVAVVALLTACGDEVPTADYEELSDDELVYVIPGSSGWGVGNPCLDADCAGPVTDQSLADAIWVVVGDIDVGDIDDDGASGSISVVVEVGEVLRGELAGQSLELQMWGPDLDSVLDARSSGHQVWAATACDGVEPRYLCYWLAVDDQGRFAGIGYGAATTLTVPLARSAAAGEHPTGRQYLTSVIGR